MKIFTLLSFSIIIIITKSWSQGTHLPLGNPAYPILDRLEILSGIPTPHHSALKYYTRGQATRYALTLDTASDIKLSELDRKDLQYIFRDNNEWLVTSKFYTRLASQREKIEGNEALTQVEVSQLSDYYVKSEKPILKWFYRTPANMLEVNDKYFHLRFNPILNFNLAKEQNREDLLFFNQRGLELRAGVDDRVYFYFSILETQGRFPEYVNQRIKRDLAVPGNGFYKDYNSQWFGDGEAYDYLNGQGYIGFNFTRHIGAQFGYGRNFIGDGYRSMLLSDFSNNYLYFKLNWNVWKFQYQNIFAELALQSHRQTLGDELVPKRYLAAHHLSFNITKNFNVGLFESVVFSRADHFEFQYLNPIILYRTVEQGLGSPDNVLIGADAKLNLFRSVQLYGQFIFDEFKFNELTNGNGWWANKFGIQGGAKYINALGIDHLDLQAEYNLARPYTYTHADSTASYAHYNQPLAHPLGANFKELILLARYQPVHKLTLEARMIRAAVGEDGVNMNYGNNILLPNNSRIADYGNTLGQGIGANINIIGLDVSYQLFHNIFLDFNAFYRKKDSDNNALDGTTRYIGGGIRANINRQRWDF
ncbi:MAG: hypothetical protein ACK4TA_07610 [Saprospiraceae bacterium]